MLELELKKMAVGVRVQGFWWVFPWSPGLEEAVKEEVRPTVVVAYWWERRQRVGWLGRRPLGGGRG